MKVSPHGDHVIIRLVTPSDSRVCVNFMPPQGGGARVAVIIAETNGAGNYGINSRVLIPYNFGGEKIPGSDTDYLIHTDRIMAFVYEDDDEAR